MRFVKESGLLTVHIINPRSTAPTICQLHELGKVQSPTLDLILQAFIGKLMGASYISQKNSINFILRPLGVFLVIRSMKKDAEVFPHDFTGWQSLICDFSIWWLSRKDSAAKLATRCNVWGRFVRPFFEYLQEEGIIPLGVVVPSLKLPKEKISFNPQQPKLLGESPALVVPANCQVESEPIDKTLAGPIFWRGDAEYLDEIESVMRSRDAILGAALEDYWLKLVRDFRTGRKLSRKISDSEWFQRISSNDWIYGYFRRNGISFVSGAKEIPLCSPKNPKGHIYLLKLIRDMIEKATSTNDFNYSAIREHPATNTTCLKKMATTPISPLRQLTTLTDDQVGKLKIDLFICRFAGIMFPVDMAVAVGILIREHANVTPDAIAGSRLLNARGKSYLMMADDRKSAAIFSVDKLRAGCRKYFVLSKKSAHVVRHILRTTAPIRALLKRAGHPHWRYLFLGKIGIGGELGHPKTISAISLWSSDESQRIGLACFYPNLAEAGLVGGTLDFAKIRATQGVLAWFDKGSVRAVHRRLGNSYRTSIEHYIPEPLLAAWNERIIRRFQNTLLVLAASEEEYLLDVVDMPNIGELHRFLAQLVYEMPAGRSPIADRIQARFGERFRIDGPEQRQPLSLAKSMNESLHIRLNPSSLALLLAYRQWAHTQLSPQSQRQQDSQTGLAPKHFIDLAMMLQAAVHSDNIGQDLSRSLDLQSLKRQFLQAEPKVSALVEQLHRKSLVFDGLGYD